MSTKTGEFPTGGEGLELTDPGTGCRVSVVIPTYNEGEEIVACLDRVFEAVKLPAEVLVVYDDALDETVPYLEKYALDEPRLRPTLNTYDKGPANAIRFGIGASRSPVIVVTMADGSDDPQQIDQLARLVERGVVVAAASRYVTGGQQVGGPFLKGFLSRMAGWSLYWFARVGTRDATNMFKAFSAKFISEVGVDSTGGFEVGLELVAKAKRLRRPVAEVPTIWLDRMQGSSSFKVAAWIPRYLRWYFFAFGRRLTPEELRKRTGRDG